MAATSLLLSSSNEISASSSPFMRTEALDGRFSTDRETRRVPRSGASPPNDLHRAGEEPERDRAGKGGMARLNGYDLLWWSDRPLLDPRWSCSSTPSTVPRVTLVNLADVCRGPAEVREFSTWWNC